MEGPPDFLRSKATEPLADVAQRAPLPPSAEEVERREAARRDEAKRETGHLTGAVTQARAVRYKIDRTEAGAQAAAGPADVKWPTQAAGEDKRKHSVRIDTCLRCAKLAWVRLKIYLF